MSFEYVPTVCACIVITGTWCADSWQLTEEYVVVFITFGEEMLVSGKVYCS